MKTIKYTLSSSTISASTRRGSVHRNVPSGVNSWRQLCPVKDAPLDDDDDDTLSAAKVSYQCIAYAIIIAYIARHFGLTLRRCAHARLCSPLPRVYCPQLLPLSYATADVDGDAV